MSVKKKIIFVVQTLTAKTQMAAMCVSVTMDMNVMILGTVQVILFLFVFFSTEISFILWYYLNFYLTSDIDECNNENYVCPENSTCVNKLGTYECLCEVGYTWNGTLCELQGI